VNNKTVDELVRMALAGGGLDMDISRRTTDELVRIALAGNNKGIRLRFTGCGRKTTDELVRIALASKGAVVFAD
jgi:hypothetical protein